MNEIRQTVRRAAPVAEGITVLLLAGLGILAAVMLWHLYAFLTDIGPVLFYPYSLDYGEGIVWQQMRDMVRGTAYGPLQIYPAIVYHYPPVYHMTSAALAALTGMDQLVAGRIVSVLSSFATAFMVGLLTAKALPKAVDVRVRTICAAMAGLFFLTSYPVMIWMPLMRVDMFSGALGLAGMLFALRSLDRPSWIYAAAAMFLLSIYAKQISVAAPMAAFSVLLLIRPKLAFRGIAVSTFFGLLALASLNWVTDGGFLRHVLFYNINRFLPSSLNDILLPQLFSHMMLIALSLLGVAASCQSIWRTAPDGNSFAGIRDRLAANRAAITALMLLIFLGLKTVMLLGILKSGASFNYMIEWFSAVAAFAGLALAPIVARAMGAISVAPKLSPAHAALALCALPLQLASLPLDFFTAPLIAQATGVGDRIVKRIKSSAGPVISDDMALLIRAGRNVEWEAAITAELGQLGKYDQLAFARMIQAHCFGLFVIEGKTDTPPFLVRYNPPVASAILSAYPREERIGGFSLRSPSEPANMALCKDLAAT